MVMKKTLAHTSWDCKYHVVWVPKNRRKIIYGKLKKDIGQILRKLCEYKGVEVVEGTACLDHIHICLSIPPKYSVSTIVGYLKGKSTMILFERYSYLRRNFRGHSFWARGYYVSTVGLDEAKIRRYIQNQQNHDAIKDRYDSDLVKDPFRGASSLL
ncbi:MAG: IS200/IS605 family transposase [Desulfobacterium sp.]